MPKGYKSSLDSYYPDRVYILRGLEGNPVTENVRKKYPEAEFRIVDDQRVDDELPDFSMGSMIDWGKKTLLLGKVQRFISQQRGQAEHYCKGPRKLIAISNGCYFSCEYCFLQGTYRGRHPRIKFNLNWEKMLREIDADIEDRRALGTQVYHMGENQDSLGFDYLYPLTKILVPFFAEREAKLLLLTKSDCADNLIGLDHNRHTIASWSMNSDYVTRHIEHGSASLQRRIEAAKKAQEAGYPLRLRFDPLLLLGSNEWKEGDWRKRYDRMMDRILSELRPERITLGSLRFHPSIKAASEQRFPDTILFDEGLLSRELDEDNRYRYRDEIRHKLYSHVIEGIKERAGDMEIGLCKETRDMWESAGLHLDKKRPTCHCQI